MFAAKGYYDGNCVRLLEPLSAKKNQPVMVHVIDEKIDASFAPGEADDAFLAALRDDRFVIPTGIHVEKYMKELRDDDRI